MWRCNGRWLYHGLWICIHPRQDGHQGIYPVLIYHSSWLGFQRMDFLIIHPQIFLRALAIVFWLFIADHFYCMLGWDYFYALVFWDNQNFARLRVFLFAGFYCYFCSDAHLRVRTISIFSAWSWNYRKLIGVFLWAGSVWCRFCCYFVHVWTALLLMLLKLGANSTVSCANNLLK